jgi:hypothetical protein
MWSGHAVDLSRSLEHAATFLDAGDTAGLRSRNDAPGLSAGEPFRLVD